MLVSNILENTVGKPLKRFQNRNKNTIENYKNEGKKA